MNEEKTAKSGSVVPCALFLGAYVIFKLIIPRLGNHMGFLTGRVSLWYQIAVYTILAAAGLYLFRDSWKAGLKAWKEHPWKSVLWFVGTVFGDLLIQTIFSIPKMFICPDYSSSINDNSVATVVTLIPAAVAVLLVAVLGPLTEEHVFRIVLAEKVSKKIPMVAAMLLSAFCFMAVHVKAITCEELLTNLPLFGTGLTYSFVLLKSKNPTIPFLQHFITNFTGVLGMLLM
ncbi:MAG: CPBP family intramembrane metalloprotease [Clostridiales bacterium]|nr:CPBP family intramembrane metalloprotease [Clostridiales bacterium]